MRLKHCRHICLTNYSGERIDVMSLCPVRWNGSAQSAQWGEATESFNPWSSGSEILLIHDNLGINNYSTKYLKGSRW